MTTFTLNGKPVSAEEAGLGQKVTLDDETKNALQGFLEKNLNDPGYREFVNGGDVAQSEIESQGLSRAQRRLAELRGVRGVALPIQRVEIDGVEWFIRRVNFESLNRIAMMTPRDKEGKLMLGADSVLTSLLSAMLYVCVVCGENDPTPFFEKWEDALSMAVDTDENVTHANSLLFSAMLKQSPEIWPDGATQLEQMEAENEQKKSGSQSLIGQSTTLEDGSKATEPIDLQAE